MKVRALWTLAVLCVATAGCYTSRAVTPQALTALSEPTDDGTVVEGHDGPPTRVDPNSMVRFRRTDGSLTPWFSARFLQTSKEGALISAGTVPLSVFREARVDGLSDADVVLLAATAPQGCYVERLDNGQVHLSAGDAGLQSWLTAFQSGRHGAATPQEVWRFQLAQPTGATVAWGAQLPEVVQAGAVTSVDGLRWEEISSAEVRNLDGFATWFAVVSSPVWFTGTLVLAGMVGGSAGGETLEVTAQGIADSNDTKNATEEPLPPERALAGNVMWTGSMLGPDATQARPLFTETAVRKSQLRTLVWTRLGGEVTTGRSSSFDLGAGVRLNDVWEMGGGLSSWWAEPFGYGETRPGLPLAPGPPRWVPNLLVWAHLGAVFETEAWRRVSLPLAFEVGYGTGDMVQLRGRIGVRVRLFQGAFVGLHPFNPQYQSESATGLQAWTFPSSMEVGSAF